MEKEAKKDGEFITYTGKADIIRGPRYNWREFAGDGIELIIGKKYKVIRCMLAQAVFVKNKPGEVVGKGADGVDIVRDVSGERYLYYWISNEQGEEIACWEGFFEETINL